jgi:hypothetical protein
MVSSIYMCSHIHVHELCDILYYIILYYILLFPFYSNETIIDITERKSMLAEPMYWTEEMCCCKTPLSGLR